MQVRRRTYPVQVFTPHHAIQGNYESIGQFVASINRPDARSVVISDATFHPLNPRSPLGAIKVPTLTLNRADVNLILFDDDTAQEEARIRQRTERVIAYLTAFVVRGEFHMGAEDVLEEMPDLWRQPFQPLTGVTIFPLVELPIPVESRYDWVMINTQTIQLFHREVTS